MAKVSKRQRRQSRMKVFLAVLLAVILASGVSFGIFMGVGGGKSVEELFEEGQQAFKEGRYQEAADLYQKALKKEPDSSTGYDLLGMAYRYQYSKTGNNTYKQKELDAFNKGVELNPGDPTSLVNLGLTLFSIGKKKEAAVYLRKALEADPNHPDRANIEEMIRKAEAPQ